VRPPVALERGRLDHCVTLSSGVGLRRDAQGTAGEPTTGKGRKDGRETYELG